jgi:hypothetical protein
MREVQQEVRSTAIPSWVRGAVIAAAGTALVAAIEFRVNAASTLATKVEVREVRQELRDDLRTIQMKLDRLIEKATARP